MDNAQLRRFFKMEPKQSGVVINYVSPLSRNLNRIQIDDVILSMEGVDIANDGSIPFRHRGERIAFESLILNKFVNQKCRLKLLRGGQVRWFVLMFLTDPLGTRS